MFKYKNINSGKIVYMKKAANISDSDKAFLKAKGLKKIPNEISCIPVKKKETKKNFPLFEYVLYVINKNPKSVAKILEEISCVSTKKAVQSTLEKLEKRGFVKKIYSENKILWKMLGT